MPLNLPSRPRISPISIPRIGGGTSRTPASNVLSPNERLGHQLSNAKKMQDLQAGELTQARKMQGIENAAKQEERNRLSMEMGAVQFYMKMVKDGIPEDQALDMAQEVGYTGETIDLEVDGPMQKLTMTNADGSKMEVEGPRNKWHMFEDNFLNAGQGNADAAFSGPGAKALMDQGFNISVTEAKAKDESRTPLGKLLNERDKLPEGSPQRAFYDKRIEKEVSQRGESITVDKDGNVQISRGPADTLHSTTEKDLEKNMVDSVSALGRLSDIERSFDDSFLEVGTRFDNWHTRWKEKAKGTIFEDFIGKASPEDQKELDEYSAFRRDAIENINRYIKEITGAQMSEKEANRLRKAMPDPGEGVFDGDSSTEFKSKWRSAVKSLRTSLVRYNYLRSRGLEDKAIESMSKTGTLPDLKSIEGMINERAHEIEGELKSKGSALSESEMRATVKKRVNEEFGLNIGGE